MTKLDLTKPKYQATRWVTCCQCHGALDTLGDIVRIKLDGVRRDFHVICYTRIRNEHVTTPELLARAGLL